MPAGWTRTRIELPPELSPQQREQVGKDIIDFIIDRTKKGRNKLNRAFPGYSKSYIKSLDFKIAGKSPGRVNLTLSGDMLAALKVLSHKKGSVLIGFDNGTEENARAEGNILGTYGGSPTGKKRDFLGITKKDLDVILSVYNAKE